MNRMYHCIITIVFCVFCVCMGLLTVVFPKQDFSELENRNLQRFPEMTKRRVFSGRFMQEFEAYVSDHVAFREQWVCLHAIGSRAIGKKENGNVYFAKQHTLIQRVEEPDLLLLKKNMDALNQFVAQSEIPVYFGLIPSAAAIWDWKLPKGAPSADEMQWINALYADSLAVPILIGESLKLHQNEAIFYRTDHHWTCLGALYGANAIFEAMGMETLAIEPNMAKVVATDFYGTTYSQACAWWTKPDEIAIYPGSEDVRVMSNFRGTMEPGNLYVDSYLDDKGKYSYFLGGNQPLCTLESKQEGERLLVIRDSYADCLAPFLIQGFQEVHLIDFRYYRASIQDYIKNEQIDKVLILYSFNNYAQDTNQILLNR